jgi:hypothetical protein
LIEGLADGQTQPPQGYVIGHAGSAHRSEENGVGGAQFREAISRHHHAVSPVIVRAPIEVFDLQFEAFHAGANLQHFKTRRNHFFADAIAWDGCYSVRSHRLDDSLRCGAGSGRSPEGNG